MTASVEVQRAFPPPWLRRAGSWFLNGEAVKDDGVRDLVFADAGHGNWLFTGRRDQRFGC